MGNIGKISKQPPILVCIYAVLAKNIKISLSRKVNKYTGVDGRLWWCFKRVKMSFSHSLEAKCSRGKRAYCVCVRNNRIFASLVTVNWKDTHYKLM